MRSVGAVLVAASLALPGMAVTAAQMPEAEIYKGPFCGCCDAWAGIAREKGYEVIVRETEDLTSLKRHLGIPREMQSCHTTLVDGYVVEGHVPFDVLDRLLEERPNIRGIAVPGMPAGSPGMGGTKQRPITIYELGMDPPTVYSVD